MASFLPMPTIREFWAARGGGLFFIKWTVFVGAQMVVSSLVGPARWTNSGIDFICNGFLWFLPPFIPALALFGFHWRTLAWGSVTVGIFSLTEVMWPHVSGLPTDMSHTFLRLSFLLASLAALPHALLLFTVRRRPYLWLVGYPAAILVSYRFDPAFILAAFSKLFNGVPLPWTFVRTVLNCTQGLAAATLVGLLLIWLMPPIEKGEVTERS